MEPVFLKVGMLLVETTSRRLFRVIWLPPQGTLIGILAVNGEMPKGRVPEVHDAEVIHRRIANRELGEATECIRPDRMSWPDEDLRLAEIQTRDARLKILEPLFKSAQAYANLFSKETRRKEFEKTGALATPEPVLPSRVLQLITQYWWFGCDNNALLRATEDTPRKVLTPARSRRKLGPKNANTRMRGQAGIYSGINVSPGDIKIFHRGLLKYWVGKNNSLAQTYREITENLYRRITIDQSGKRVSNKIDKFLIPTERQFRHHAEKIIQEHDLTPLKVGQLDWSQNKMARHGSATDIIEGPTDIYDMDVGVLKVVLITDGPHPEELGLMSVALCIDRGSRAITGFYPFMGAERWEHYRLALFYALTSYRSLLTMHGADQAVVDDAEKPDGFMVNGWCQSIYCDRGPGRSIEAVEAVCKRLKIGKALAPAQRGDMKAVVESLVGQLQLLAAPMEGGYGRIKGLRNKEIAKKARGFARLTWKDMFRFLVAAIADHNTYFPVTHLVTKEMLEDGELSPVPKALFRWGQQHVRGIGHHLSEAETFLRLMPTKTARLTQEGVTHNKVLFVSPELAKVYGQNVGKRNKTVEIFWNGYDEQTRYWKMPNGKLGILRPALQDRKKFGDSTASEIELRQTKDRAAIADLEREKHKKGFVSLVKTSLLAEAAALKKAPIAKRGLNTPARNAAHQNLKNAEAMAAATEKTLAPLHEDGGVGLGSRFGMPPIPASASNPVATVPSGSSWDQTMHDAATAAFRNRKRRGDD